MLDGELGIPVPGDHGNSFDVSDTLNVRQRFLDDDFLQRQGSVKVVCGVAYSENNKALRVYEMYEGGAMEVRNEIPMEDAPSLDGLEIYVFPVTQSDVIYNVHKIEQIANDPLVTALGWMTNKMFNKVFQL